MPDRIIRDELLESDRWLDLPSARERLAYVVLLLGADTLGNHEASAHRLAKAWSSAIDGCTKEQAEAILQTLVNADLVRLYEGNSPGEHLASKRYLHIPRYRQRLRYIKRLHPISPWTTDEEKQALRYNSPGDSQVITWSTLGDSQVRTPEVKRSEVSRYDMKGVEVKRSEPPRHKTIPPEGAFTRLRDALKSTPVVKILDSQNPTPKPNGNDEISDRPGNHPADQTPVKILASDLPRGWSKPGNDEAIKAACKMLGINPGRDTYKTVIQKIRERINAP